MGSAYEFEIQRGNRTITYVLSSQGISRSSRIRRKLIRWERVRTLWDLENSYILFFSDTGYRVMPKESMPSEAQAFLMEKVREVGIRIKSLR